MGTRLYLRSLDAFEAIALPGTDGARQPFFAPDGEWVAYFSNRTLFRVRISGGLPIPIGSIPLRSDDLVPLQPSGGAWGPGDVIVFSAGDDLWRVTLEGDEPERIPLFVSSVEEAGTAETGEEGTRATGESVGVGRGGWPSFLPVQTGADTEDLLVLTRLGQGELSAVSVANGSARLLGIQASGHARYAPSGHIVYTLASGVARAVPIDLASLEVTGPPLSVLDDVFQPNLTAATILAISESGTLVYVPGASLRTLVLVDRGGRETPLSFISGRYRFPTFSPDGSRLVVRRDGDGLVLLDLVSGADRRIAGGIFAAWSPSGNEIVHDAGTRLLRTGVAPGSPSEAVFDGPMPQYATDWGRDGRLLLQQLGEGYETETQSGVFIASIGANAPEVVIDSPYDERDADRSPDGRLVSYTSDVSGRKEVYVKGLGPDDDPVPVSVNGGTSPIWSATGDELFFWNGEQAFAAQISPSDPPEPSTPVPLFTGRYVTNGPNWDVSSSGEFVVVSAGPNWLREIRVVQNWSEELRQLAPQP